MRPNTTPATLLAGALALALLAVAVPSRAASPDFSGTWRFAQQRSDRVREKVLASVGPAYSQGDIKKDAPRLWIRNWLVSLGERPDAGVLTIEQTPQEFHSGLGDEVRIYYFGRESTRQGDGGPLRKAAVHWQGEQVVVEEHSEKGSGKMTEIYTLLPDGKTLVVAWRLEHKTLQQPLDLKLVFEKTATP